MSASSSQLKQYFKQSPRLVTTLGKASQSPSAEQEQIFVDWSKFKPTPQDELRADLLIINLPIADPSKVVHKIVLGTHEAGYVYMAKPTQKMTQALLAAGFKPVPKVSGLFQKSAPEYGGDYGDDYIARWGDTDFLANAELSATQILGRIPESFDRNTVRVIDVGSLNAYIMESLYRAGVKNIYGTDISFPIAIKHTVNPYHLAATRVGDFLDNTYADEAFDVTICMEVLEHIPPESTDQFVAELARITRPDGRLLISASEDWEVDETHINCRNRPEWYQIFARHGLVAVGEQVIFPGFNNFVLRKAHNLIEKDLHQAYYAARVMLGGKMVRPSGK